VFAAGGWGRVNAARSGTSASNLPRPDRTASDKTQKERKSKGLRLYPAVTLFPARRNELGKVPPPWQPCRANSEVNMKLVPLIFPTFVCLLVGSAVLAEEQVRINPTDPQPTCNLHK